MCRRLGHLQDLGLLVWSAREIQLPFSRYIACLMAIYEIILRTFFDLQSFPQLPMERRGGGQGSI